MDIYYTGRTYYTLEDCWDIHAKTGGKFILNKRDYLKCCEMKPHLAHDFIESEKIRANFTGIIVNTVANAELVNREKVQAILHYHGPGWGHLLVSNLHRFSKKPLPKFNTFYDFFFCSGPRDALKYKWHFNLTDRDVEKRCIPIGWFRSDIVYGQKCKKKEARKKLGISGTTKPVVLYAPTGTFADSSLPTHGVTICEKLHESCTLLIRAHPQHQGLAEELKELKERKGYENIHFIDGLTMGIIENMAAADLLISDQSAIVMDWMFFDKPIIFADTPLAHHIEGLEWSTGERFNVQKCGYKFSPGQENLADLVHHSIADNPFKQQIADYRNDMFYFNDGKACDRAAEFITTLSGKFKTFDPRKSNLKFEVFKNLEQLNIIFVLEDIEDWGLFKPVFKELIEREKHIECYLLLNQEPTPAMQPILQDIFKEGVKQLPDGKHAAGHIVLTVNKLKVDYPPEIIVGSIIADGHIVSRGIKNTGTRTVDFAFVAGEYARTHIKDFDQNKVVLTGPPRFNDIKSINICSADNERNILIAPDSNSPRSCLEIIPDAVTQMPDFKFHIFISSDLDTPYKILCKRLEKILPNLSVYEARDPRNIFAKTSLLISDSHPCAWEFAAFGGKVILYDLKQHQEKGKQYPEIEYTHRNIGIKVSDSNALIESINNQPEKDVPHPQKTENLRKLLYGDNFKNDAASTIIEILDIARPKGWVVGTNGNLKFRKQD